MRSGGRSCSAQPRARSVARGDSARSRRASARVARAAAVVAAEEVQVARRAAGRRLVAAPLVAASCGGSSERGGSVLVLLRAAHAESANTRPAHTEQNDLPRMEAGAYTTVPERKKPGGAGVHPATWATAAARSRTLACTKPRFGRARAPASICIEVAQTSAHELGDWGRNKDNRRRLMSELCAVHKIVAAPDGRCVLCHRPKLSFVAEDESVASKTFTALLGLACSRRWLRRVHVHAAERERIESKPRGSRSGAMQGSANLTDSTRATPQAALPNAQAPSEEPTEAAQARPSP